MLRAALIAASLLLATPALADDYAPGPGTDGVIKLGGTVTGVFDYPGDDDTFKVTLPKDDRAFAFTVTSPCHWTTVSIWDAGFRRVLATSEWRPLNPYPAATVEWRPAYAGLYYIQVNDHHLPDKYVCSEPPNDAYTLEANVTCLGSIATNCALRSRPEGVSVTGVLRGIDDRNWYRFTVDKHKLVSAAVDGTFARTPPIITLRRANGKFMVDNAADPHWSCILGASCLMQDLCPGTYYIALRDDEIARYTLAFKVYRPLVPPPCP